MSFPFVQPYFGLGNSLQTAQASGGGAVGGWVELARTTLGSTSTTIDVSSIPDKRYYQVLLDFPRSGTSQCGMRINNDSGSNYSRRYTYNGASDSTGTSETSFDFTGNGSSTNNFSIMHIANLAGKEKLIMNQIHEGGSAGAGNIGDRREQVSKWANTSNALDQLTAIVSANNYASGAEMVVLGWDPTDTHTTNFWEELASVTLGGDASEISSGTISAKKYLWVQVYFQNASSSDDVLVRFNNDTGSNYAHRHAINYGSDTTQTSGSSIKLIDRNAAADVGRFVNFFVVNNSATEKLLIAHGLEEETAGASNAPTTNECVGKWANTSSQITEIDCFTNSGNIRSGAELRVWGSN
jgi:hypothetical protein